MPARINKVLSCSQAKATPCFKKEQEDRRCCTEYGVWSRE